MRAQSERTLEGTVGRNQALRSIAAPTSEPLHRHELRQSVKESDKPGNRSSGPCFHSTPFHRLKSPKAGCPGAHERVNFCQIPLPGRPCIRALPKSPPSQHPQTQSDLCRSGQTSGLTPARQPPGDSPRLTRSSEVSQGGPVCRPGWGHFAALHYGQIACVAPKHPIAPQPTCQRLAAIFTT